VPASAECVRYVQRVRASAKVLSCQKLELGPSSAQHALPEEQLAKMGSHAYFDDQTSRFSGTLLFVEFQSDARDEQGKFSNWPGNWQKGQSLALVSTQPAETLCKSGPAVEVTPDQVCCDTFPSQGACIFPGWLNIARAVVTPRATERR
jgi:hypothetical protein